ncbi:MAG: hypothetical protein AB4290_24450 [Spirulina sp.]
MPDNKNLLRYDPDENISRHGATDPQKCEEMQQKYKWNLIRVEITDDKILEVDCVFEGETEFPDWYKEQERKEER